MTAEERRCWAGEMSRKEGTSRHGAAESVGGGETGPHKVAAAEWDTHGRGLTLVSSLGRQVEVNGGRRGLRGHGRPGRRHDRARAATGGQREAEHAETAPMSQRTAPEPSGFHCECHVDERRLGIFDAHSTGEALRWLKATLMMVAISMDEEPYRQARDWIEHGQDEATRHLSEGKAHTLTLKQRTTHATWTVTPVRYFPPPKQTDTSM